MLFSRSHAMLALFLRFAPRWQKGYIMKTPVTIHSLRHHFTYNWWKYALLIFLAGFGWNLIYTVSEYRPPEHKKIETTLYVVGDVEALSAYIEDVRLTKMSDMEQMIARVTLLDQMYGDAVFSTHVGAGHGDVYWMPPDYFQRYAVSGTFIALDQDEALMAILGTAGIDLSACYLTKNGAQEAHLYGIPCADLPGISRYVATPENCVIGILSGCGNEDNALKFLRILVEDTMQDGSMEED